MFWLCSVAQRGFATRARYRHEHMPKQPESLAYSSFNSTYSSLGVWEREGGIKCVIIGNDGFDKMMNSQVHRRLNQKLKLPKCFIFQGLSTDEELYFWCFAYSIVSAHSTLL
jgi:hypothetical protein